MVCHNQREECICVTLIREVEVKKVILILIALMFVGIANARNVKVAILGFTNVSQQGQAFRSNQAVEAFGITQDLLSSYTEEVLTTLISSRTPFTVVERRKIASLIKEQDFNRSGLVNNSDMAVRLGELLGANYIITGSIVNIGKKQRNFRGYGISTQNTVYTIEISAKMLDVNSGVIATAGLYSAKMTVQDTNFSQSRNTGMVRALLKKALEKFAKDMNKYYASNLQPQPKPVVVAKVKIPVSSTPDGADVEVDGIYMGSTPCTVEIDADKIVKVQVSMSGYKNWIKKVKGINGLKIKAHLDKEDAVLRQEIKVKTDGN